MKARLASEGSTHSTSARVLAGGRATRANGPPAASSKSVVSSASVVEKGMFLTRIAVLERFTLPCLSNATSSPPSAADEPPTARPSSSSMLRVSPSICVSPSASRTAALPSDSFPSTAALEVPSRCAVASATVLDARKSEFQL